MCIIFFWCDENFSLAYIILLSMNPNDEIHFYGDDSGSYSILSVNTKDIFYIYSLHQTISCIYSIY